MKLKPSLKEKNHYLVFSIIANKKINDYSLVENTIKEANLSFIGQLGCARANPMVIKDCWNSAKQKGIIKVDSKHMAEIKTSVSLIKNINKEKVIINCIGVSGTLKKAKSKFM